MEDQREGGVTMTFTHSPPCSLLSRGGSHFLPLQPVLMRSTASYAPCHSQHRALLWYPDRTGSSCLQQAVTRQGGHQGWLMGLQPAHLSQPVEIGDLAVVTAAEICLPGSCWPFFFCIPPKGSGKVQRQARNTESWVSFCVLVLVSWRSLSLQISHFRLCAPCL